MDVSTRSLTALRKARVGSSGDGSWLMSLVEKLFWRPRADDRAAQLRISSFSSSNHRISGMSGGLVRTNIYLKFCFKLVYVYVFVWGMYEFWGRGCWHDHKSTQLNHHCCNMILLLKLSSLADILYKSETFWCTITDRQSHKLGIVW